MDRRQRLHVTLDTGTRIFYRPHPQDGESNVFTSVYVHGGYPMVSGPRFLPWSLVPGFF